MNATAAVVWTEHTFICARCHRVTRASQEAIDASRVNEWHPEGATDADVAQSFEFCLSCCDGKPVEGEHPCLSCSLRDVETSPDVQRVWFRDRGHRLPVEGIIRAGRPWQASQWCSECRTEGAHKNDLEVVLAS